MTGQDLQPATWRVWVDTGGTFTDCLALDPDGTLHRAKVLSSSALRGRVAEIEDARTLRYDADWPEIDGFAVGARLAGLGDAPRKILGSDGRARRLELDGDLTLTPSATLDITRDTTFELRFAEEAPVLAARWVTGTAAGEPLPPLALRLATTRGTNALLERRGASTAFFVTRGFADLLEIGTQQRPDLFALDIRRPEPLYDAVVEVPERLAADGSVLEKLDLAPLEDRIARLLRAGVDSAAVALLHSYRNPVHEKVLAAFLEERGFACVASSAELAPLIKILPRAETAIVDAYLMPIIEAYLERVRGALAAGSSRIQVMTSAGGLVRADRYRAKDSLLSGPAGGVVGSARAGRECGAERLIAFDMGGTSTDVSRYDGDYEYLFEHRVGDATVAAPALSIETVAAGGGSICRLDGEKLKVGPLSAGADPGPASYGVGGPLTLTDVNLLLGRLDPDRIGIPIDVAAAEAALTELCGRLPSSSDLPREEILEGFLRIANERMADAVRRISVRRGYDPREYSLVAFGGAGGQHACALAELLGMTKVLLPPDAGLLSALGLGAAVVERFAQRQVLGPLDTPGTPLADTLEELAEEAISEVAAEGVDRGEIEVRRRLAHLRFAGQEATVEVEIRDDLDVDVLATHFLERYEALYGYRPESREVEVESLRIVASSRAEEPVVETGEAIADREISAEATRRVYLGGAWREVAVHAREELQPGDVFAGPAFVFDAHSSLVIDVSWRARTVGSGAVVVEKDR